MPRRLLWVDSTSAFVCKGKVAALILLQKTLEFLEVFMQFGTQAETLDHILDKLEQFTYHLSGSSKLTKINKLRHAKFQ